MLKFFKSMNSGEGLFRSDHVQALLVTDGFWWVKADCRPEMKKDKLYKMVMSLCRGSWKFNSALCGCAAGRGSRALCKHRGSRALCKHIGALCCAVANFCLYGQLPGFFDLQIWCKCATYLQKDDSWPAQSDNKRNFRQTNQPIPGIYDPRPPP